MADGMESSERAGAAARSLAGRPVQQAYFLEVPGTVSAKGLSVMSFTAVERMGDSYTVTIDLTHAEALERADYLNKDATFMIDPGDGSEPRKFCGCIARFSSTKTTKDFRGYQIVVEALVARLRLTRTSRIYQHQSAPQIIESILRRHELKGHQFSFRLRRKYPQHAFRFQHQLTDWSYIRLLMEQEGIYCYIAAGKFGDEVVFADDIDHYVYLPELKVPYREKSGLESGVEAVYGLQMHAETVPASFRVADYNPDHAYERLKADATSRARTPRPTVSRMCTARITWTRRGRNGKRGCVTRRRWRGRSSTRAKATCSHCGRRAFCAWRRLSRRRVRSPLGRRRTSPGRRRRTGR